VVAKRTFEDGIAIFRSIAESDAFKEMRGRIRDGASRVAESDRVPRVLAGSAGIVAALLTDVDEEEDLQAAEELEPLVDEPSEMVVPSASVDTDDVGDDADDDEVPDSVAAVRDLDGADALDAPPEEEEEDELEDDESPIGFVRSDEAPDGVSKAAPQVGVADVVAEPPIAEPPIAEPPIAEPPIAEPPIAEPPIAAPIDPKDAGSKLPKRASKAPPPTRRSIPPTKSANAAGGAAKRAKAAKKAVAKDAPAKAKKGPAKKGKGPVKAAAKKETPPKRRAPSKSGATKKPVAKPAKKSSRARTKKSS
jgi:hypothetical protein